MSIEAMKLALEALEVGWSPTYVNGVDAKEKGMKAITALRQAIEQAEQAQPVAIKTLSKIGKAVGYWRADLVPPHIRPDSHDITPLYTAPPPCQPLTEWKPMETALFNTDLLVINNGFISQGYRSDQYQNTWTHWMPLPAPPIEAAHGIKGEA